MLVKDLKKLLNEFDGDLTVIVKDESRQIETRPNKLSWEYDGYCKIVINND